MITDPFLADLYRKSTFRQALVFKGLALASMLCGAVFLVLILVMPHKHGELGAVVVIGLFGLGLIVSGPIIWLMGSRISSGLRRLLARPSEIASMDLFTARGKYGLHVWSVMMVDRAGKKVGLIVANEDVGREAIERLRLVAAGAV